MKAADISPVAPGEQTQSSLDLFLIFVGANIVATTFQVGASLVADFSPGTTLGLVGLGSVAGALLVAALAPIGSRLRVPSIVATRAALGIRGAGLVAVVLYATNFAWIALNNVIAASACARVAGGDASLAAWSVALGLAATAVVAGGPRAVARADRFAVPLMLLVGVALSVACLQARPAPSILPRAGMSWFRGLDVVIGYQVSWILMFADYPRYTRSLRGSTVAVFLGLALTSIWMMPLGAIAARAAGRADPGAMLAAVGLGRSGALLLALATLTTNFVNIYMSSLAWKSLFPSSGDRSAIWSIGIIGTVLGALPGVWLEQYTTFMMTLGAILIPVGGVLVAHFYIRPGLGAWRAARIDAFIPVLYDPAGPLAHVSRAGLIAWIAGIVAFFVSGNTGGTVPALAASMMVYILLARPPAQSPLMH